MRRRFDRAVSGWRPHRRGATLLRARVELAVVLFLASWSFDATFRVGEDWRSRLVTAVVLGFMLAVLRRRHDHDR